MTQQLAIGPHTVRPPVVLAPMAGITNAPFRTLCREFSGGRGLFVSEMITTRALVERDAKTMRLIRFDASEKPRSIQLYGVDPATVGKAVRMIADEDLADHIDLNFGCPVPKVTRKGGGSALPYKRPLLRAILREAVTGAGRAAGDDEDAQGHRRRPHSPIWTPAASPWRRASPPSPCTAAPPPSTTAAPPTGRPSRG